MPGIAGLITKAPREWAERKLSGMVDTMRHDPSWRVGTLADESLGVYVGWTAPKGSFSDTMPLRNEGGDVVLVFSGEDFAEPGTIHRLKRRGHELGAEESSYLVHLCEDDPAFPAELNGRFHGLAVKRGPGTATLFNDRYGMHRICYHQSNEAFYFAAEAKAILAACPELRTLDPQGVGEFVACTCVLENRTLFKGINVLPPASAWAFSNATLERKGTYFQTREWEDQTPLEPEAYYRELREVFSRNLPRYFNGRERIAMSLTGGLDTRMIMAWQNSSPGFLPCYSFGSMFRDCHDVIVARQVARACGQTHEVIPVGEEYLSQFSNYAERAIYLTDGCVDVSHSTDLFANERAAKIAPVRMTGNYGGEILRRVRTFKPVDPTPGLFVPEVSSSVETAKEIYATLLQGHALSFALFLQCPWYHYGLLSLEQTQVSLRTPFLDNDIVRTVYRAPQSACESNDISRRLIADGNAPLARIRTDRGVFKNGFRGRALRGLIGFSKKAEYAYDYGMPHWAARIDQMLSPIHVERLFLGRHKFYHFRVWYRDYLSEYIRNMLLDPRTLSRPYLERKKVEAIVRGHLREGRNYTSEIHKLLTLELVSQVLLDSQ